ncbi:MAG TPA: M28 family peptidase [Pirellulales bacterium]|nr:M28 family peptidase [Pirellulales bacterium]
MPERGWKQLLAGWPWFQGEGAYPIAAYSEFMPPPRLGRKAYGNVDHTLFDDEDLWGWRVSEYEEAWELQPGLRTLAGEILQSLRRLGRGKAAHGISRHKLEDNPYWPESLHERGAPAHERYVILMPLALARTQDDKGRVRWTLFGASEQGPARAFWRGMFRSPRQELPAEQAMGFLRRLLASAYGEPPDKLGDLRRAGFRVFAPASEHLLSYWRDDPLPSWTNELQWSKGQSLRGVRWLLTFEPFSRLPEPVQRAYLAGDLHLLPFPGSLVFWGCRGYLSLADELPLGVQIPLLHLIERHEGPRGIRIPQSGIMHEPQEGRPTPKGDGLEGHPPMNHHGPLRNHFRRTHRWERVHRHEDSLAMSKSEDKVAHVLFSAEADDVGLYGKPMARNAQIWTHDDHLLLDGPRATHEQLSQAAGQLAAGGLFGYRFFYPAMRVGRHEVYWHRPLVAYLSDDDKPVVVADGPLGWLTAYDAERPRPDRPIELWPRLVRRPPHQTAIEIFDHEHDQHYRVTAVNIRKLLEAWELFDRRPLSRAFARQLLTLPKEESLDDWLASLPNRSSNAKAAESLVSTLKQCLAKESDAKATSGRRGSKTARTTDAPEALTFDRTARRSFETAYWRTIYKLAAGRYVNKDNADCVLDRKTRRRLVHHHRDLEALGDYLLRYYRRLVERKQMAGKALVGELPFFWKTDFNFEWSGGWSNNQQQTTYERDLMVVIPGRDRRRAVIMADHYDTAYMEDIYGYSHGGHGPRLAAAGADDNHSATAALMLGAPIFLDLSRAGRLACDVWLVHLTGEEFPSDCLGARHLAQCLVEGTLRLHLPGGRRRDLSRTRVQGLYVLDMVAHNNDRNCDVFQICPGTSRESMWLAYQAHEANRAWNVLSREWNQRPSRRGCARGRRSADGKTLPETALHPHLHGEVRPTIDPRSTLYNTDGQIFSDAGVPVVLFMENYDINRKGYHDTHDTMENIDLDYGSAVAAIAIEAVARAATRKPERRPETR